MTNILLGTVWDARSILMKRKPRIYDSLNLTINSEKALRQFRVKREKKPETKNLKVSGLNQRMTCSLCMPTSAQA